ncbi:MAG: hypothetical protein PVG89_05290 [Gammaproteobacteria bacterium]|jgi:hypothetical protein
MLDYLEHSVRRYQELHGRKPDLIYLNHIHLQSLLQQLETQDAKVSLFGECEIRIILSPSLIHPALSCSHPKLDTVYQH